MKNLIIFLFIISISSCRNNVDCNVPGGYDFLFKATLSPAQTTFEIGDTISILSTFSDTVFDRTTNRNFVLEDWGFRVYTNISKIDSNPALNLVTDHFDVIVDEEFNMNLNTSTNIAQYITLSLIYENNEYSLAYKFITKEAGLFYFTLGISPNDNQTFDGMCEKVGGTFKAFIDLNEGSNNNIDLLLESPDEHYNTWRYEKPEDRFHREGAYVFRVE